MTDDSFFHDIDNRIWKLLESMSAVLDDSERAHVVEFVRHDEFGEAVRSLAWIIAEKNAAVVEEGHVREVHDLARRMNITADLPQE